MSEQAGTIPVGVPARARRTGEAGHKPYNAEPLVWTERMLEALERGVQGGKWYSLIDKIVSVEVLDRAFTKVASNRGAAGVDHVTVDQFASRREEELARLSEELRTGKYRPQPIRRQYIPKPGSREKRPLGIPTIRDRTVQAALLMALEPIYERGFAEHSYGFRPGRGARDGLRRVDALLRDGYSFVVDVDLKSYFDSIPHERLLALVGEKVADGKVMELIAGFLRQGIMDGLQIWVPTMGTPQGAVISPLLSNIYLDPLDQTMAEQGFEMVRYADDFVILCRSQRDAEEALARVQAWATRVGLTLHPTKTRLVDAREEAFEFLGYRFYGGRKWPRAKSLDKFRTTIRAKTKRTAGKSLARIIEDINRTLRGWFGYFKHSYKTTFGDLDGWVRMRLRSILRKQQGRRGVAKGADHQRWTNAYFTRQGLFCLKHAHVRARQSPRG